MGTPYISNKPELWGGIECTINRIDAAYRDQLSETGHYDRDGDIALLASTGIKKMRYPVLWEKHQPERDTIIDWSWADKQLNLLRDHSVEPIIGLLHHGSGPGFTSLLDEYFPDKFAEYAGQVATQFPWVTYYTPINEPLTTARFSGLYGLWYPHMDADVFFYQMVVTQVLATIKAMEKIRQVNPAAKLIQTEDLCKVHSTPLLQYQADFENERRWLSYDLLCGKVDREHRFWKPLLHAGISVYTLHFIYSNKCCPDIMGLNYYVTSERYLDEHIDNYPLELRGSNKQHTYADTEAVRVGCASGLEQLLTEAWERYHQPLAITECHLDCTREEQMRWLMETWTTACTLFEKDIPVVAVAVWSMLGSYDWDSLITVSSGHYAPGAFDIRTSPPKRTALARMMKDLTNTECTPHPVLAGKGWWRAKVNEVVDASPAPSLEVAIIAMQDNVLLHHLVLCCQIRGIPFVVIAPSHEHTDKLYSIKPWAIINLAGAEKQLLVNGLLQCAKHLKVRSLKFVEEDKDHRYRANEGTVHTNLTEDLTITIPAGVDERQGLHYCNIAIDLLIDESAGVSSLENSSRQIPSMSN